MSRIRHRAKGGAVVYAGEGSNVLKDAKERKFGGSVKGEGDKPKGRGDKRARGGSVGAAVAPGRKRGGSVGADKHPMSSAASSKKLPMEEAGTEGGGHKGENVPNP